MSLPTAASTVDSGSTKPRARILVFVDYYLPGFKFGGPVRTLANMANRLNTYFQFFIFTSDRDEGDFKPYTDVLLDQWTSTESSSVYYTSDRSLGNIARRIEEIKPDLIYLNSFFSRVTIKVLLARRFGWFAGVPVLLAPRGEFADGALAIKPSRKRAYIWFANAAGLLRDVTLHASTEFEKLEIVRWLTRSLHRTRAAAPLVASDLPGTVTHTVTERLSRIPKKAGELRAIFLARISRNKNLHGALQMMGGLRGAVHFTVCGPIGDQKYWQECLAIIRTLPPNIEVELKEGISHEAVPEILSSRDLMLLPTHGENFGHSIIESLTVGCPVLISDRTPWRNLEAAGVGADLPLDQPERFTEFMQRVIEMDDPAFSSWASRTREYGLACAQSPELLSQNLRMFTEAMLHRAKA